MASGLDETGKLQFACTAVLQLIDVPPVPAGASHAYMLSVLAGCTCPSLTRGACCLSMLCQNFYYRLSELSVQQQQAKDPAAPAHQWQMCSTSM
jgi:hypothetical protein